MAKPSKGENVQVVLEKDLVDDVRCTKCIDGCTGGEEGFVLCIHCCFWFHLQCFGLVSAPVKGNWYCSDTCRQKGPRICIPIGEPSEDWDNEQLKAYCKHFALKTSGNKEELLVRLQGMLQSGLELWGDEKIHPPFSRFVARQGPQRRSDLDNSKSLDWFSVLWGDDVWQMPLEATNVYGRTEKGGWKLGEETSVEELKAYIGLRIRMGIYGVGQARDLWKTELLDEKVVAECYSEVFPRVGGFDTQLARR